MKGRFLTDKLVTEFSAHLKNEEKSQNTTEKYLRDVRMFAAHFRGTEITKDMMFFLFRRLIPITLHFMARIYLNCSNHMKNS